jgi:CBS domain containing-hemolysin-like protein
MKDDIDRPLAAILTLNTFAHTLGAAGVGAQAAILWGDASVGIVSFIVTLMILIFSEIIPKTLGAVHSKTLAPLASWVTDILIIMLKPFVAVAKWIAGRLTPTSGLVPTVSRDEVSSMAWIALEEGSVDEDEANVIGNLIGLRDVRVEEVMTPRTVVFTYREDQTVDEVARGEASRFARIPVVGSSHDDVRGQVHRHQLFAALGQGRGDTRLGDLARPIHIVPDAAKLSNVLKEFVERREHLFWVVDELGQYVGIITLEDVIETILGVEIVDETDSVADMRKMARELAKRRHDQRLS